MLIHASRLLGTRVLSLQLGGPIAEVTDLVVDPDNLKIIAFRLAGPTIGGDTGNLLDARSIREFSNLGFIVDDADELIFQSDVVKIDEIMQLNFRFTGLKVVTEKGRRLGKVSDFVVDSGSFLTQQLIVQRPALKSFLDPELTIHRSQIVEVDDYKVTVKSAAEKAPAPAAKSEDFVPNFVNPFRSTDPKPAEAGEAASNAASTNATVDANTTNDAAAAANPNATTNPAQPDDPVAK